LGEFATARGTDAELILVEKLEAGFWLTIFVLSLAVFGVSNLAFAGVGVGIQTGKIIVDQPLKPGVIYSLPPVIVINTGDVPAEYTTSVQYHFEQEQNPEMGLRPPAEWFTFEPATFHLDPGKIQSVGVTLKLPVKAPPGKYFAYLQAQPIQKAEGGVSLIRVAAATKLWFTVVPANWWMGIYYRLLSLYAIYVFWVRLVLGIIIFAVLVTLFRKFFAFNIQLKRPGAEKITETEPPSKTSKSRRSKKI